MKRLLAALSPAGPARRWSRRAPADPWSALFGQIAAHALVVLVVTGILLAVFYRPDMARSAYEGPYRPLKGVVVSEAYASTVRLSLEVRGGLLLRQVHHWATLIFVAAICLKLVRMFFTGAFRRPRLPLWSIWVLLLVLGMAAGLTGTILPDDMLSGGSLALIQGVLQSIPLVGTRLTFWLFDGDFPGEAIVPRFYWLHTVVLPVAIIGLFVLRHRLVRRHGRPRLPAAATRGPHWLRSLPVAAGPALFFGTCGVLVLLGAFAQINPVWLLGPYRPGEITAGAVPDWYMGFLDGAVRLMPGWEFEVAGRTLTVAVLVPALIIPGAFFTFLAAYPLIERRLTGDREPHHELDRPRDAATRTGVGAGALAFYGLLWAAAANDQIAVRFHLSVNDVTDFLRAAVLAGPVFAFVLTRWFCLGLLERASHEAAHGRETGRIVRTPEGGYIEITEPVRDGRRPASLEPSGSSGTRPGITPTG
ncbi:cytochrome bc1 complex cytochrome b subunit [Streptomyces sp. H39-S7]|uniref:cytochrome bc1 complex cytochrome b subunit n=1 Tax=Streptomyces sp. H39-S7 TaxID=3004357 RepID=UPI0022AE8ECA|nr:cytochrome b N-terminal domain-containing protein [Streptomyces sp. H39-S7]MCZ4119967.1 cytochrome b N-terminal domain-containing protein [Streptomyces sp. H39-S7]